MSKRRVKSIHTTISFWLIFVAVFVELALGVRYYFYGEDAFDRTFGMITLLEGFFALGGLYLPDLILYNKDFELFPRDLPSPKSATYIRAIVLWLILVLTQFAFQFVPLVVREPDKALAIIFAAPAEESFFRGLILTIFILLGERSTYKIKLSEKRSISFIELTGIILSSVLFMFIHVNYYEFLNLLLAVFFSGIVLGFAYWYWRDLTACVLAHFFLNFFHVFQSFYLVTF